MSTTWKRIKYTKENCTDYKKKAKKLKVNTNKTNLIKNNNEHDMGIVLNGVELENMQEFCCGGGAESNGEAANKNIRTKNMQNMIYILKIMGIQLSLKLMCVN